MRGGSARKGALPGLQSRVCREVLANLQTVPLPFAYAPVESDHPYLIEIAKELLFFIIQP